MRTVFPFVLQRRLPRAFPLCIIEHMKFLSDLLPVLLFFAAYSLTGNIYLATGVAIVSTAAQVGISWFKHRKVEPMQWVSLALILVLGGLTLVLHDKRFIMWKPTVLYWLLGAGFLISDLAFRKNPIKAMMGKQIELPERLWAKLTFAWYGFFAFMGALNLFVAFNFSEAVWVNFKLFGGMGLMLVFVLAQGMVLSRYIQEKN